MLESAEIKKASTDLEARYRPRQQQVEKLQKDLQALQQNLQTNAGKLTPAAEADLTAQGQRKQREMQRLTEDLQADVDRERQDILGRSSQRMQAVVKKLAEAKGLDVVVDVSNTVYFKPDLEITTEAIAAYDRASEVRPSGTPSLVKALAYLSQTGDLTGTRHLLPDVALNIAPTGLEFVVTTLADVATLGDYNSAYRLWGCTETKPCPDYPFNKFMDDWGPKSKYAQIASFKIAKSRACGSGVIVTLDLGQNREERLWVETADMTIGYSPWTVCPAR